MSVNFISLVNTALGFHDTPYAITPLQPGDLTLQKATIKNEQVIEVKRKIRELYPTWNNEKVVLFNVNASDMLPQRRWQPENFAAVATSLLTEFNDIVIVATGAPAEREYVQNVTTMVNDKRFVNSSGIFHFNELVPLYSISYFMVTNDSGPAHFAAVTDLKVFVLFGPETPTLYLPMGNAEAIYLGLPCSPCVSAANHRKTTCQPRPCITTISPKMVETRLKNFMMKKDFVV
jgi:ADP-heptose:LPS heptosyltransferase